MDKFDNWWNIWDSQRQMPSETNNLFYKFRSILTLIMVPIKGREGKGGDG